MAVDVEATKKLIFNLNNIVDRVYSLFEVVNTYGPGYGRPIGPYGEPEDYRDSPGYGESEGY